MTPSLCPTALRTRRQREQKPSIVIDMSSTQNDPYSTAAASRRHGNSEDQGSRREQQQSATDGQTNDDLIAGAHHADGGAADQLDPIVQQIELYARAFATTHDLEQYSNEIVWAAKVRHDQQRTIEEDGFPPHEREVLEGEGARIFSLHRRSLKSAVLVVGVLSAGCQGWYQSVISSTSTLHTVKMFSQNAMVTSAHQTCSNIHDQRFQSTSRQESSSKSW